MGGANPLISCRWAAGGPAKYLLLPEVGQKGNNHMLMLDKNNPAIADLIIG
jgi:hypothetical protein